MIQPQHQSPLSKIMMNSGDAEEDSSSLVLVSPQSVLSSPGKSSSGKVKGRKLKSSKKKALLKSITPSGLTEEGERQKLNKSPSDSIQQPSSSTRSYKRSLSVNDVHLREKQTTAAAITTTSMTTKQSNSSLEMGSFQFSQYDFPAPGDMDDHPFEEPIIHRPQGQRDEDGVKQLSEERFAASPSKHRFTTEATMPLIARTFGRSLSLKDIENTVAATLPSKVGSTSTASVPTTPLRRGKKPVDPRRSLSDRSLTAKRAHSRSSGLRRSSIDPIRHVTESRGRRSRGEASPSSKSSSRNKSPKDRNSIAPRSTRDNLKLAQARSRSRSQSRTRSMDLFSSRKYLKGNVFLDQQRLGHHRPQPGCRCGCGERNRGSIDFCHHISPYTKGGSRNCRSLSIRRSSAAPAVDATAGPRARALKQRAKSMRDLHATVHCSPATTTPRRLQSLQSLTSVSKTKRAASMSPKRESKPSSKAHAGVSSPLKSKSSSRHKKTNTTTTSRKSSSKSPKRHRSKVTSDEVPSSAPTPRRALSLVEDGKTKRTVALSPRRFNSIVVPPFDNSPDNNSTLAEVIAHAYEEDQREEEKEASSRRRRSQRSPSSSRTRRKSSSASPASRKSASSTRRSSTKRISSSSSRRKSCSASPASRKSSGTHRSSTSKRSSRRKSCSSSPASRKSSSTKTTATSTSTSTTKKRSSQSPRRLKSLPASSGSTSSKISKALAALAFADLDATDPS